MQITEPFYMICTAIRVDAQFDLPGECRMGSLSVLLCTVRYAVYILEGNQTLSNIQINT